MVKIRISLFLVMSLLLFSSLAYSLNEESLNCVCELYRGQDFENAARTTVDAGTSQCIASCYDESGVMIPACYFDGNYYLALSCVGKGWVDCNGGDESCVSHSNTTSKEGKRGADDLYNFLVETVDKDGTLDDSQVQCTSAIYQTIENENPRAYHEDAPAGRACCGNHDVLMEGPDDSGVLTQGTIPDQFICSYTAIDHKWQWLYARQNEGSIYHVDLGNFDVVSDGTDWFACDAAEDGTENFAPRDPEKQVMEETGTLLDQRFICYQDGDSTAERIAECKGADTAMNDNLGGGKVLPTGGSVKIEEMDYFCSSNSDWLDDLDLTNPTTCEAAGYEWTGSACCGGENNADDTYNDRFWQINGTRISLAQGIDIGGCFQNMKIDNNTRLADGNYVKNGDFSRGSGSSFPFWEEMSGSVSVQGTGQGKSLQMIQPPAYVSQDISGLMQPGRRYRLSTEALSFVTGESPYAVIYVDGAIYEPSLATGTKHAQLELIESEFTAPSSNDNVELRIGIGNPRFTASEEASTDQNPEANNGQNGEDSGSGQSENSVTGAATSSGYAFFDNVKLKFAKANLMNLDGMFYGCMIPDSERNQLSDTHNFGELVPPERNFQQACIVKGDYFCSPGGSWENSLEGAPSDSERDTPTSVPDPLRQEFESPDSCCPENYCWNGTMCIFSEDYITEPISPLQHEDDIYRCIAGEWRRSVIQETWDGSETGFCPSETQCLVDPEGLSENNNKPELYGLSQEKINQIYGDNSSIEEGNPQCIGSEQFIGDHLCENASWTSRTKSLATQMLDIAVKEGEGNNYALFCDDYEDVLVDYGYESVESYLLGEISSSSSVLQEEEHSCPGSSFPCVNNFCVLRLPDKGKVVFGTSLNTEINHPDYSFLEAIGEDSNACNDLVGTGNPFRRCTVGDYSLWYSDKLNAVMFSDQGMNIEEISLWDSFVQVIKHPFQGMLNFFQGKELTSPPNIEHDLGFIKKAKDFNRIYMARSSGKSVQGIIEAPLPDRQFMEIGYAGFDDDICRSARVYRDEHPSEVGYTFCAESGDEKYVVSYQPDVLAVWDHFTSRIRLDR